VGELGPQAAIERRIAARHLMAHPFTCAEHDPDVFALIRRHGGELDRWFTQRFGYRLHIDADTTRLYKSGLLPHQRPLRTHTDRPMHHREQVLLALVLAATAAGPSVTSLRDLVASVRSAAVEAGVSLHDDAQERRAFVTVLRWMIRHGLATELYEHVDAYADDQAADAVLAMRPDRISLLPMPALVGTQVRDELLARAERRSTGRQWMRGRLAEDPVLYRDDLDEAEWGELRRRVGEESRIFDEMFGLTIEARAEGLAAIDGANELSDLRFPAGGTESHAALLLIEELAKSDDSIVPAETVVRIVTALAQVHARHWSGDLVAAPDRLARRIVSLLAGLRLVELADDGAVRLLPGAARFRVVPKEPDKQPAQDALW
jgi:uncharacterized protein (TIGR02678 family)